MELIRNSIGEAAATETVGIIGSGIFNTWPIRKKFGLTPGLAAMSASTDTPKRVAMVPNMSFFATVYVRGVAVSAGLGIDVVSGRRNAGVEVDADVAQRMGEGNAGVAVPADWHPVRDIIIQQAAKTKLCRIMRL